MQTKERLCTSVSVKSLVYFFKGGVPDSTRKSRLVPQTCPSMYTFPIGRGGCGDHPARAHVQSSGGARKFSVGWSGWIAGIHVSQPPHTCNIWNAGSGEKDQITVVLISCR